MGFGRSVGLMIKVGTKLSRDAASDYSKSRSLPLETILQEITDSSMKKPTE